MELTDLEFMNLMSIGENFYNLEKIREHHDSLFKQPIIDMINGDGEWEIIMDTLRYAYKNNKWSKYMPSALMLDKIEEYYKYSKKYFPEEKVAGLSNVILRNAPIVTNYMEERKEKDEYKEVYIGPGTRIDEAIKEFFHTWNTLKRSYKDNSANKLYMRFNCCFIYGDEIKSITDLYAIYAYNTIYLDAKRNFEFKE